MAPSTPRLVVPIDLKKAAWEQKLPFHNRWHPKIPPVAEVKAGEFFRVEMVDATGGGIKDDDSSLDVKHIDASTVSILLEELLYGTGQTLIWNQNDLYLVDCDLCGNWAQVHYLSGPIRVLDVDGVPAKPGDLLAVEICNLGPLPGDEWGYTATFDRENGGGFLTDHFPCATKAIWYFEGINAYSPHIPGESSTYV
ncbi:hypothetical protein VitviT2T_010909 [Vitis vinifera]|uniref:Formamidase n=1 Tax=Vitis vinifera TaxID=29760 RepID=A0ABY9C9V4_VITVI|nr:hypothetical protein VitviT2T_010909 [Vitis vinifera]